MSAAPVFDKITIIGLGLIGSSIARAAREYRLADIIAGCDENETSLTYARAHDIVDTAARDPRAVVATSQLIVLATPPARFGEIAKHIAPHLPAGAIVMDVGSVKQPAMEAIAPHLPPRVDFIPAHPIAGSEQSGVSAGRADLFQKKRVIVTPAEPTQTESLKSITAFWSRMGARAEAMPAELHDRIYAAVSHLPQLLAFAAAGIVKNEEKSGSLPLQKFLRLTRSDPALWTEIFFLNKYNIINYMNRYLDVIYHIKNELAQAPENDKKTDEKTARALLFPRIASSCLITTVMEAEKQAGVPFARYAGTGFADFTAPAATPAEDDMEKISGHARAVAATLEEFTSNLKKLRGAMETGDARALQKALTD